MSTTQEADSSKSIYKRPPRVYIGEKRKGAWDMNLQNNTEARRQHEAVRQASGWFPWTHSILEVSGREAVDFLHAVFCAGFAKTAVGRSKYTLMLDDSGCILDDTIVMHVAENRWWITTMDAPAMKRRLGEFLPDFDAVLTDRSGTAEMFALQGPRAPALLDTLLEESAGEIRRFGFAPRRLRDIPVLLHRSGFTGEDGFEIFCAAEDAAAVEAVLRAAVDLTPITLPEVYLRTLSVEKGLTLQEDIQGLSPDECGMGRSADVSRAFAGRDGLLALRDRPPRYAIMGLEHSGSAEAGQTVCIDGQPRGRITAATYGFTVEKFIGYAVMEAAFALPGQRVILPDGSGATLTEKGWI